ncbi:MAG: hypothetical protein D6707_06420 [Bacteroidetes bacterium]|nr:MAG: hypothetical protein D6707_06420 [Bacteroidota bacterium]
MPNAKGQKPNTKYQMPIRPVHFVTTEDTETNENQKTNTKININNANFCRGEWQFASFINARQHSPPEGDIIVARGVSPGKGRIQAM